MGQGRCKYKTHSRASLFYEVTQLAVVESQRMLLDHHRGRTRCPNWEEKMQLRGMENYVENMTDAINVHRNLLQYNINGDILVQAK